jgi:hypothetical protein
MGRVLVVSLVFGIPVAYAAAAIIGIPAVHLLESRHWLRWPPLIAIAVVTGALAFTGAEALFLGEWSWLSGSLVAASPVERRAHSCGSWACGPTGRPRP